MTSVVTRPGFFVACCPRMSGVKKVFYMFLHELCPSEQYWNDGNTDHDKKKVKKNKVFLTIK